MGRRRTVVVALAAALTLASLTPGPAAAAASPSASTSTSTAQAGPEAQEGAVAPGGEPTGTVEPTAAPGTVEPSAPPSATGSASPTGVPTSGGTAGQSPGPTTVPTAGPTTGTTVEPTADQPAEQTAEATTDASPPPRPVVVPAIGRSSIPLGSVLLSLAVLLVGALLVAAYVRRAPAAAATGAAGTTAAAAGATAAGTTAAGVADHEDEGPDPATLDFLLELGRALVDAGDAINHVQETLEEVAAVHGAREVGIVVMPTALFISVPGRDGVQTEVAGAGVAPLRLDQVEEVFRVVAAARTGGLGPTAGLVALARARTAPPPFGPRMMLLGHVLFTLGLVLILRGGWPELALGAVLGVLVGALQLGGERLRPGYHPFLPVLAALGASVIVFTTARLFPGLEVFPPLVASLVAFLPGALLTTAVFELSTGQIVSGAGRLAAGGLRLVLLALGILAGSSLVGLPAGAIGDPPTGAVGVLAPWAGVAVFGVGVVLFKGARRSSLPWVLLVLYVAYAGQVVGGLFFGSALSAFFGALAMTPVAMIAARQPTGPPALVSFLPGFWLLVPGAVGLEGVTQFLDQDTLGGIASLVTMGTSMVGISLGVLLGLVIATEVAARTRLGEGADSPADVAEATPGQST
jgi:uncharacterized membrane protein YjjP (DUF1212 family)/uncharacterized membrane protein YjjB (DUF3815 family)